MTNIPSFNFHVRCYDPQNALGLALASELSYQNESAIREQTARWGFGQFRFFENKESQKQAFIAANDEAILVAFRGTDQDEIKDWLADLNFFLDDGPWGKVHYGFQHALSSVWFDMKAFLMPLLDPKRKLLITGHSLGGAMAVLAAADLIKEGLSVHNLYTFGQPKAGNGAFAHELNKREKPYYFRFVNHNDIVPRILPSMIFDYQHAGQKYYFDGNGKLHRRQLPYIEELWDRIAYKWLPCLVPHEDFGDHSMKKYIENLEKNQ